MLNAMQTTPSPSPAQPLQPPPPPPPPPQQQPQQQQQQQQPPSPLPSPTASKCTAIRRSGKFAGTVCGNNLAGRVPGLCGHHDGLAKRRNISAYHRWGVPALGAV